MFMNEPWNLSFSKGEQLLLKEGYVAEYCNYVIVVEYIDGCMIWKPIKARPEPK